MGGKAHGGDINLQHQNIMKAKAKIAFGRMSAAAKRVAIAKDVIAQIRAKQYRIKCGIWLSVDGIDTDVGVEGACQAALLGQEIKIEPAKCDCCALGAAMASSLRLFNIGEFCNDVELGDLTKQLGKFFSKEQMGLIEATFECRSEPLCELAPEGKDEFSDLFIYNTARFRRMTCENRAIAIFENIIKNKGTFKP
jgi:hypothetical protein